MNDVMEVLLVEGEGGQGLVQPAFQEKQFAHPLHTVRSGSEAAEYLAGAAVRPGLVLLDVGRSSVDHLRILKDTPAARTIPVVVMTSSKEERDMVESYDLGVAGYVVWPTNPAAVAEALRTVLLYWSLSESPRG